MKYIVPLLVIFRYACAVMVVIMMGLVVVSITFRAMRIGYIPSHEEFIQFLAGLCIYFGVAPLQQEKGHIRVKILVNYFPDKVKPLIDVVSWIFFLIFFGVLLHEGWKMVVTSWKANERLLGISIPVYPMKLGFVIGCLFMVIQLLNDLLISFWEFLKKKDSFQNESN